ncbi:MAG: TonB-dependent receptor [Chitinophagaceae bacterium]|nr:TonB-dependent receptor [Chitinophagaceae bacterium]
MRIFLLPMLLFIGFIGVAQTASVADSARSVDMDEVVVTATRSERLLGNTAVPVTLIRQQTIRQSGSLRLHDILGEQTGLFITQGFGRGVQMQGLSPDYTLILLDGEPLIGRMGGVLDLTRLTVGNIRKIEIVKGPSSSLYGSEALAGVINIITDGSGQRKFQADARYGRFNTADLSVDGSTRFGRLRLTGFLNYNSTQGYSLLPNSIQKTVEPYWRLTGQQSIAYDLSERTRFRASFRQHHEDIVNSIVVQNLGSQLLSKGRELNNDYNITPSLSHRFSDAVRTTLRGYASEFSSRQLLDVAGESNSYNDRFRQRFIRIEDQTDISLGASLSLNVGGGYILETVRSNRYDSLETERRNTIGYAFLQQEWRATEKLVFTGGVRYDRNATYASVWSPKLAVQFRPTASLRINASVGRGFKAPDFRQLYLNFTNIAAGSYSVFGSLVAAEEIRRLQADGQIDQVLPAFGLLKDLKPETSTGINLGLQYDLRPGWQAKVNLFRNDIENLILTDIIAYKRNGGQIFSYLNVSEAFTQGLEAELAARPAEKLSVSGGYQFLITADKSVLAEIRAGRVYKREASTGISSQLDRAGYAGLPGRSMHMANLKLFYGSEADRWSANLRMIWRSRWGTSDLDGNGLINRDDEFARGYLQVNLAGSFRVNRMLHVMAGIDNLFNYSDPYNLPGQPGINPFLRLSLSNPGSNSKSLSIK